MLILMLQCSAAVARSLLLAGVAGGHFAFGEVCCTILYLGLYAKYVPHGRDVKTYSTRIYPSVRVNLDYQSV